MGIVRHFRNEAVRRVYRQGAILYLLLALIVLVLTNLLPPLRAESSQAVPRWESLTVSLFLLVITALVVWRGLQLLTFLLSLFCLAQALNHLIAAMGLRLTPALETALPPDRLDWAGWQEFVLGELATETPFYGREAIASGTPVDLLAPLRSWPVIGGILPSAGPLVPQAYVFVVCAILLGLATLVLWRAARLRPR